MASRGEIVIRPGSIACGKGLRRVGVVPSTTRRIRAGRPAASLLGIALTLVLAGCGSDDEPARISKSEFLEKASVICVSTRRGIRADFETYARGREGRSDALAEKAGKLTPEEAAAKVGGKIIVPAMKRELEELRALGIPQGDGARVNALLSAFEEGVEKAEAHPERAAATGTEAFGRSGKLAGEYGLEGC